MQSPTNTELSRHVGNLQATTISFGGGMIILFVAVLLAGNGDLTAIGDASLWQVIGGLYGTFMVFVITVAVPVLGIALITTFIMLGQMFIGMLIDGFGLFLVPQSEISTARILGCIIVVIGIFFVLMGRRETAANVKMGLKTVAVSVLSFIAGIGGGIQAPTNAALSTHVGTLEASFISFTGGFIIIFTVTLIASGGKLKGLRSNGVKPWMVIGGFYGCFAVLSGIIATPVIGVALSLACTLLGQLACGILVDSTGILRSAKIKMNAWRIIGVLIISIGVILFSYGKL